MSSDPPSDFNAGASSPPPQGGSRSDADLIAALNSGDDSAFDALYNRYRDWVARLARRFTGNHEDALDVLQETFLYLAGKFPGLRLTVTLQSFLYPVVKNLSIATRKKSQRYRLDQSTLNTATASPEPEPTDSRTELSAVLAALPDPQREVILMRFVDDLSLQEIADALRIPQGTVKSRLHIAIETLRSDPRTREYFNP